MYKIKLSPYAKIFYNEWLFDLNSSRYNLSIDQILHGNLDVDRLKNALNRYISDHVILNSHIQDTDGEPCWIKNSGIDQLEYITSQVGKAELFSYVSVSFDLHAGPLYRFKLLSISKNTYRLILVFHHIVVDGSISLDSGVFEAISNYYNDENYHIKQSIDEQIQAISNLTDKLSVNLGKHKEEHKDFWHKQLSDVESIDLSFLKLNKNSEQQNIIELLNPKAEINFSFGDAELAKLNQIKSIYNITPYAYGQCIFALLLYRYTGQDKLAISYPISIKEGIDFVYGAQINTNLIPYQFSLNTTIVDLFNQNKEFFSSTIRQDIKHAYHPITNIVQDSAGKELLNTCFAQTFFRENPLKFNGITKIETSTELSIDGIAENTIVFEHDARDSKLSYRIRYDKNTINKNLLSNFVDSYKKLYSEILEDLSNGNNDKQIFNYNILSSEQYNQIIYEFNDTNKDYPKNKTIHQLFEEQVLKTPDNIAVAYEDIRLTYQELNNKANQLAHYLKQHYNIKPDNLVILCLDRNEQMIIAILGVLKAGGAYVPVDPSYPDERIGYVLDDTKAKVILTNQIHTDKLEQIAKQKGGATSIISIDNKTLQNELNNQENNHPIALATSNNLAYVIYTSGTTGNPKGVMIEHCNVINYIMHMINYNNLNKKSAGGQYASLSFDALVIEIYPILLSGGVLCIVNEQNKLDPIKTNDFFNVNKITYAFLPTKFAELFFDLKNSKLINIIVGGEKLKKVASKTYRIVNAYGPTEATVQSTSFIVDTNNQYLDIPIGKPIDNVKCYVVDNKLNILPIGVCGELMIGGIGLARGYLNNPNLTTEKFIPNPFQTKEEKSQNRNYRLYKTGDLVRWLPDGNLEYIGRNDFQVKIRGYRIELGEIENKISSYPGVKQAVVLAKERSLEKTSDKYLLAYYVADEELNEAEIHAYLITHLPGYMVPGALVYLKQLPMTINGKLNTRVLPEPEYKSNNEYIAPSSETERLICAAFTKVLGIKNISITDDFFLLGGNSIQAIRLASILHDNFDVKVADIFKLRTVSKLVETLHFGENVLKQKLESVKAVYLDNTSNGYVIDKQSQEKMDDYIESADKLPSNCFLQKPITNILLTGGTGFLGCNILRQLLESTNYNIFLPVRASSQAAAIKRLNEKFNLYFDKTLDDTYGKRVFVLKSHLDQENLGLSESEYQDLGIKIDSIIHSAALVKHYGDYNTSYLANVQVTINLLELAKLTELKDFHYISTYSVLDNNAYISTEADVPDYTKQEHVYIKTKLQGEHQVIKYRDYGITSNIYRVGNLAFIAENCRTQENIEENAFLNWMKCLFELQCVAPEISTIDISPVDLTAQAIVKLFDKNQLSNEIYHVFNPHLFDLSKTVIKDQALCIKTLPIEQFIDIIINELEIDNGHRDLITKFLLRQGWMGDFDTGNMISTKILQHKTQYILEHLGFMWLPITAKMFGKYLELLN